MGKSAGLPLDVRVEVATEVQRARRKLAQAADSQIPPELAGLNKSIFVTNNLLPPELTGDPGHYVEVPQRSGPTLPSEAAPCGGYSQTKEAAVTELATQTSVNRYIL